MGLALKYSHLETFLHPEGPVHDILPNSIGKDYHSSLMTSFMNEMPTKHIYFLLPERQALFKVGGH
jgi:hypothetical protein